MSKMKSHSGAKKRFKKTGSGGVKHRQSHKGHILTKKSTKRKRQLRPMKMMATQDAKVIVDTMLAQ